MSGIEIATGELVGQSKSMNEEQKPCAECGMHCSVGEYHPYAACLMFKACHNSETVRANLDFVRNTRPDSKPYKFDTHWDALRCHKDQMGLYYDAGAFSAGFNASRERKEG